MKLTAGASGIFSAGDYYLRPEVKIEPLVCGWYAWTHLVSPAQHALNVVFRHLPLLNSFVKSPAVHVAASNDPTLYGGPFVDLPDCRVADVQQLIRETELRCGKLIEFGRSLKAFDKLIQDSATGFSLSEFYGQLPETLQGLVEFFYDINSHPKLRLYEELLYDDDLAAGTQEIQMSLVRESERKFFMSTPRLRSPDGLHFPMRFCDKRLDLIASMRTAPRSLSEVARAFEIDVSRQSAFEKLFTSIRPERRDPEYGGDEVRVRYFGHACILIQSKRTNILVDPMFAWDADHADGRLTFADLPDRIDYVVLSHNHQDHCAPEMLIQLRHRVGRVIVPRNNSGSVTDPSMKLTLFKLGFEKVDVVDAFDEIRLSDGSIVSLPFPGEHVDLDIHSRHGIFIQLCGKRLCFLVDSDGWDAHLFRRVAKRIGKQFDALFIGMECHGAPLSWLYGPLLTKPISRRNDESRRLSGLDSGRALNVLKEFDVSNLFVYAMGQEPWLKYIMGLEYTPDSMQLKEVAALLERCKEAKMRAESLYISRELVF